MRKLEYGREIIAADRDQKGAELARRLREPAALLEELAEYNVAHAEPQGGKIEETVVTATAADRAGRFLGIEQLEQDARVVREPTHDCQVDRDEITETHALERLNGLAQRLGG